MELQMSLHKLRSKLMARMGAGARSLARFPNFEAMASDLRPQPESATLMWLPLEIRKAIFEELWKDAGSSQHIMLRKGRYVRATCLTDNGAPDELMEECTRRRTSRFEDEVLWRRMQSTWGNHWKCEQEFDRHVTSSMDDGDANRWRTPFLAIMLVCKQLYIESRMSIFSFVNFVIHDISTLKSLTTAGGPPFISAVKTLSLAIRLPIRREFQMKMSPEAHTAMKRWRECCAALNKAAESNELNSVDLWLDTSEPAWRGVLSSVPDEPANPFCFGERLAAILTVNLPVNPERPEVWRRVSEVEPRFAVRPRGWPAFRVGDATETSSHTISRLWETAEPGAEQSGPIQSISHAHHRPWYLRGS